MEKIQCPKCNSPRENLSTLGQWAGGKEFECDNCKHTFDYEM